MPHSSSTPTSSSSSPATAPPSDSAPSGSSTGFAAWARRETTGGLLLGGATILALVLANSGAADAYTSVRDYTFGPAALHLDLSVGTWAADGLLAVFFFVVGVELKRELVAGSLADPRAALVPIAAAVGGVVAPVAVYVAVVLLMDGGAQALSGWAVPAATDIAFALAVLAAISRHLPTALRTFLLTLAVVDDLIAITVIAVGYTEDLALMPLALSLVPLAAFAVAVRRFPAWWLLVPLALLAWGLVHASGVHATIAGVLLGLVVPVLAANRDRDAGTSEDREAAADDGPAAHYEHVLKPWSSCLAVPVFAFFAAGVAVGGLGGLAESLTTPVAVAVILGLVLGKLVGVTGATWLVTRAPGVRLDPSLRWGDLTGLALLSGIGFTVSLLIGDLAFGGGSDFADDVKVGVLVGSLTAGAGAVAVLGTLSLRRRPSDEQAGEQRDPASSART